MLKYLCLVQTGMLPKVTVSLPVLKVLDTKLDVNQSRLYDYNKGFLSLGPDLVKLQESALRESIRKIEQASCKEWLMKTANERVQQTAQGSIPVWTKHKYLSMESY